MTVKQGLRAALASAPIIVLAGCGVLTGPVGTGPAGTEPPAPTLPKVEATLTGRLTDVTPLDPAGHSSPVTVGTIATEEPPAPNAMVFEITDRTMFFREYAGQGVSELTEISFSALRTGVIARVGYSGPVRESYPAQATADYVVLEDPGS